MAERERAEKGREIVRGKTCTFGPKERSTFQDLEKRVKDQETQKEQERERELVRKGEKWES